MQDKIIFVSYYTENTIYEKIVNTHLLPSLKRWKLDYDIAKIPSCNHWKLNAIQKPIIVQNALEKYPDKNIIWIDADATINRYPCLLFEITDRYDVGVNYLSWETHYGRPDDKDKFEMLDGTVYWKNCPEVYKFVEEWKQRSTLKKIDHQKTMASMLRERPDIKVWDMPRTYSYIETQPNGNAPAIPLHSPVISHYQASRKARRNLHE